MAISPIGPNIESQPLNDNFAYLNQRFSNLGIINVKDFGAKGDGMTDDTNAIQAAMNAVSAAGGGIVLLPVGVFVANVKIASNCGIEGSGRKSIIKIPNNSTEAAVSLVDGNVRNIYLNNFSIDGNKANQSSSVRGLHINGNTTIVGSITSVQTRDARHFIKDIFITSTKGVGFEVNGRGESVIDSVQSIQSDDHGMVLSAVDNWYGNLSSGENKNHGIIVSGNNCRLVNVKSWNNGIGNTAKTAGYGIHMIGVDNVYVQGEAQANLLDGIYMQNVRMSTVDLFSDANGKRDAIISDGVSGFTMSECIFNIVRGSARNRTSTGEIYTNYAVSLIGSCVRNIINVTADLMAIGTVFDSGSNLEKNIVNVYAADLSSVNLITTTQLNTTTRSLSTFTTWAQINAVLPNPSVVVIEPQQILTLLPNASLVWGTVTISKFSGGRMSATLSSNLNGLVISYVGTLNNSTGNMDWKLVTEAGNLTNISGNGTTAVSFAHGLGYTPTSVSVQAANAVAGTSVISYVTANNTNITVNFVNNTPSGTNNLAVYWSAK